MPQQWHRRPRTRAEREAINQSALRFARQFVTRYPNTRRQHYIRYVMRRMEALGYPAYVIRVAVRAINDGRDPRFSFGDYNDLGDGTYSGYYDD